MVHAAMQNHQNRKIEVSVKRLLEQLRENRVKHVSDYEEAMASYKERRREKVIEATAAAHDALKKSESKHLQMLQDMTDEEILREPDVLQLARAVTVDLQVPHNYVEVYDEAIASLEWEQNDTIVITMAEFNCLVRDHWDWKVEFTRVTQLYKKSEF